MNTPYTPIKKKIRKEEFALHSPFSTSGKRRYKRPHTLGSQKKFPYTPSI